MCMGQNVYNGTRDWRTFGDGRYWLPSSHTRVTQANLLLTNVSMINAFQWQNRWQSACYSYSKHKQQQQQMREKSKFRTHLAATQLPVRVEFIFNRSFAAMTTTMMMIGWLKLFSMAQNLPWPAAVTCRIVQFDSGWANNEGERGTHDKKKISNWYTDSTLTSSWHADSWKCAAHDLMNYVWIVGIYPPASSVSCRLHRVAHRVCVRFGGFGVINDAVGEFYKTGHWQTLPSLAHIIIDANFIFNFFFLRAAAAMFRRHKNKRLHFARIFVIIIWRTVAVHFTRTARRPCHVDIYVALIPRVNVKWQTMDSVCGACVCVCVCHQWRMDRAGLALAHVPLPLYAKAISDCRRINE